MMMPVKTTEVPPVKCPTCDAVNDYATETMAMGRMPQPGDASMCLMCGHMMIFKHDLTTRLPTEDEAAELARDPRVKWMQRVRAYVMRRRLH